jgi:LysM repeat protein
LASIAEAYGVTVEAIVELNELSDPNIVEVGQELMIPRP